MREHTQRLITAINLRTTLGIAIVFLILVAGWGTASGDPTTAFVSGEIHGVILVSPVRPDPSAPEPMPLPGIQLELRSAKPRPPGSATSAVSASVRTNEDGKYILPGQPWGTYRVCVVSDGYEKECTTSFAVFGSAVVFLRPLVVQPRGKVVYGQVTNHDGSPVRFINPQRHIDAEPVVTLTGPGVSPRTTMTNERGWYMFSDVHGHDLRIRADLEGAHIEVPVVGTGRTTLVNVVLANSSPSISMMLATGTHGVSRVEPGATVEIEAEAIDPDGDMLHYDWRASLGVIEATAEPNVVRWTSPNIDSANSVELLVGDGKGGYAISRYNLWTRPDASLVARFAGRVVEEEFLDCPPLINCVPTMLESPVAGATVRVNGTVTTTTAEGHFSLTTAKQNRYAIDVEKLGFASSTWVTYDEVLGDTYRLKRAQEFVIDPTVGADVHETPVNPLDQSTRVVIPPDALVDSMGFPPTGPVRLFVHTYNVRERSHELPGDSTGTDGLPASGVGVVSHGATFLQAVDASGNQVDLAPSMSAQVEISVLPGIMPPATMPTWTFESSLVGTWLRRPGDAIQGGANWTLIMESLNEMINIGAPIGNTACIRVVLAGLTPPRLVRITYTDITGSFQQDKFMNELLNVVIALPANVIVTFQAIGIDGNPIGQARSVNTGPGTPFINNPPSPYPGCRHVALNDPGIPYGATWLDHAGLSTESEAAEYYAAIDPQTAAGVGTVSLGTCSGPPTRCLIIGSGTDFLANPQLRPGDLIRVWKPTENRIKQGQVRLVTDVSDGTNLNVSQQFNFSLPIGALSFERVGTKPTLADWKTQNGFDAGDDASAFYTNRADLGFGRSMHMRKVDSNHVAYYVTNYGVPYALSEVNANKTVVGSAPVATVAMEYTPEIDELGTDVLLPTLIPAGTTVYPYVKFYVYGADGTRILSADLDNEQEKFVPLLCVTCHGNYAQDRKRSTELTDVRKFIRGDLQAKFDPFDVDALVFPTSVFPAFRKALQQANLKDLNRAILEVEVNAAAVNDAINGTTPPSGDNDLVKLIKGWYLDDLSRTEQDGSFIPDGWRSPSPEDGYNEVVKPYCQSCHITRTEVNFAGFIPLCGGACGLAGYPPGGLAFASFDTFKAITDRTQSHVCGSSQGDKISMPNAKVTYESFWRSNALSILRSLPVGFGSPPWDTGTECPYIPPGCWPFCQ